jgi:hypothetical protein
MPGKLALTDDDWQVFDKLAGTSKLREKLAQVIKEFNTATRKKVVVE